jgi:phage shock protein PspC (stress-responsive transcriptional regulator)
MSSGRPPGYLPQVRTGAERRGLARPRRGALVAGVLAGLARRFGIGAWTARVLFLLSMLLPGPQIVAYLVLWVIMPREG